MTSLLLGPAAHRAVRTRGALYYYATPGCPRTARDAPCVLYMGTHADGSHVVMVHPASVPLLREGARQRNLRLVELDRTSALAAVEERLLDVPAGHD